MLGAPAEVDALGMLALTLFDRWQRDAIFVLVRTFVDESGTGGEGRILLGSLTAKATEWHGFHNKWRKLLRDEGIEYSHVVDMENRRQPFEAWGVPRTNQFIMKADEIIQQHCQFGYTSAVSIDDHREHYRQHLPKQHKDSPYGQCARSLIEGIVETTVAAWGSNVVINFVFEDNQHFEDARRIFRELKDHVPSIAPNMGQIAPGDKKEFGGLQASDIIASLYRRCAGELNAKDARCRRCA